MKSISRLFLLTIYGTCFYNNHVAAHLGEDLSFFRNDEDAQIAALMRVEKATEVNGFWSRELWGSHSKGGKSKSGKSKSGKGKGSKSKSSKGRRGLSEELPQSQSDLDVPIESAVDERQVKASEVIGFWSRELWGSHSTSGKSKTGKSKRGSSKSGKGRRGLSDEMAQSRNDLDVSVESAVDHQVKDSAVSGFWSRELWGSHSKSGKGKSGSKKSGKSKSGKGRRELAAEKLSHQPHTATDLSIEASVEEHHVEASEVSGFWSRELWGSHSKSNGKSKSGKSKSGKSKSGKGKSQKSRDMLRRALVTDEQTQSRNDAPSVQSAVEKQQIEASEAISGFWSRELWGSHSKSGKGKSGKSKRGKSKRGKGHFIRRALDESPSHAQNAVVSGF